MILVRSGRETSTGYKQGWPGQRFLASIVLNVHHVGHPCAEA
jgi:hypothetical protein